MWKILVLREHSHTSLVHTSLVWFNLSLEGIEITSMSHHLKRVNLIEFSI